MQKNARQGILVVDDEKTNLDVLNHILKEEYTVYVAKNGAADYITKPFNNAVVKARIRNQMQTVRQFRLIEKIGGIDPLTEVSDRAGFERQLAAEWERAVRDDEPISMLCLDVDSFRQYNDTHGYIQGNVMLQEMVKVFPQNLRRSADFVARLGGGKFVALLPNTDRRGASAIAEEIRRTVAGLAIIRTGPADAGITVSIGVAEKWPARGGEYGDILAEAESELRRAKQLGRNRVCIRE